MIIRVTVLALLVLAFEDRASSQTQLHSLSLGGSWDSRSIGDVDADGVVDFAVSHPGTSDLGCNVGQGIVYVHSGRTGLQLYQCTPPPGSQFYAFGWSIDAIGDVNADGRPDFIVGAPKFGSLSQCGEGRAYMCSGLDGTVLHTLVGPRNQTGNLELFGRTVAGVGDVNADGVPDVCVGAEYGNNPFGVWSGYICIYSGFDGSIIRPIYGTWNAERFGTCCAAAGDVNADGHDDILVGSPYAVYAAGPGGVRIYSGSDGLLLTFITGTPSTGSIGWGVKSIGDIDADSVPDFITGTLTSARVYSGQSGTLIRTLQATPASLNGQGWAPFPHPFDGVGDLDADGVSDVVVVHGTSAKITSGATGASIASYSLQPAGLGISSVGPATDLNGDGYADLLCASDGTAGPSVVDVVLWNCPVPSNYCAGKLNSIGCIPSISSSGVLSQSLGNDDFNAIGMSVRNNSPGLLLWGLNPNAAPFFGGTLCVGPGLSRTPGQSSGGSASGIDCTGSFSFNFTRTYAAGHGLLPGARIHAQYWSRDSGYSPPNNVSLTNGLTFTYCP